eukprot:TRINITY_DN5101_c0_g1_i1.p1 TRINITY_DN5101_c0_g1~~TRINITY_DN5101_c0_g1_i1.p1  ORF type:complete len:514 (+),score=164.61 TRINITY_DN5101_c0_g1_i1:94-1635(+)
MEKKDERSNLNEIMREFVKEGQISLSNSKLKHLLSQHSNQEIIDQLSDLARNGDITFPFKRYFMPSDAPEVMAKNLKEYNYELEKSRGEEVHNYQPPRYQPSRLILSNRVDFIHRSKEGKGEEDDYNNIDIFSDYFQEEERMNAKRSDCNESPMQFWRNNSQEAFRNLIRKMKCDEKVDMDSHQLREILWTAKLVKECTLFKPSLVKSVYRHFGAKRILDISAGWGDRLFAAICHGSEFYLAADPNLGLEKGHSNIIQRLCADSNEMDRFKIIRKPFQEITAEEIEKEAGGKESFDLVFTSPPFFDFEIYTENEGQSVKSYPQLEDWIVHFLFASIEKSWKQLKRGGHLALHITDVFKTKICSAMNYFAMSLENARIEKSYRSIIGCIGGQSKVFPIWVWKKSEEGMEEDVEGRQLARDLLHYNFPKISIKLNANYKPVNPDPQEGREERGREERRERNDRNYQQTQRDNRDYRNNDDYRGNYRNDYRGNNHRDSRHEYRSQRDERHHPYKKQ